MKDIIQPLRDFFLTGQTFDVQWRMSQLRALLRMLDEQAGTLAAALFADLHKSAEEAWLTETGFVQHEARFALRHVKSWARPLRTRVPLFLMPSSFCVRPQPRGLALIISPWNYPVQLTLSPLVAAISAGNVCVVKPSELAPATAQWFSDYIPKYLDMRAFAVIQAGPEKTSELLKEPFDFIFFTGSTRTAKYIARAAAEHLTPTVLELGGKSPCIVTHCRHLETAANRIAFAKFVNAGQTCVAPDYVLVQDDLREPFEAALKEAIVRQFGPENETGQMTRIIHDGHFRRLDGMLGHGEKLVFGGFRDAETRAFAPTVMETDMSHPAMQEEIFGPILPILSLKSANPIAEAVECAMAHPSPLAAYLFSDSADDVRAMEKFISGGFAHNDALMHLTNVHVPFGGVGASGHGASHGKAGFDAFSHHRSELHAAASPDIPLRYPPYSESSMKWLKWFMK
ncbi:MAG: aldehyde dehydrogenase family protein [Proteobacteria bacterium]|nr:aldehyde dehydrogenase family protein [Pseudomonadota bacterium]